MTVQELFASINEEEFIDTYLKNDNETLECIFNKEISINEIVLKVNYFKELVLKTLNRFKTMQIEPDDEYIVFAIPDDDGGLPTDTFLVKKDDLQNKKANDIERYCYDFSPHTETLSYPVSDACIHRVDDNVLLAVAIFNEMTFLGIEENHDIKVKEIVHELEKTTKEIEAGLAKTESAEKVFKELGFEDNRTPQEKVFSYMLTSTRNNYYVQLLDTYFELEKYYLKRKGEKKDVI